jgi:dCTP deaminase
MSSPLSDKEIIEYVQKHKMIEPFVSETVRKPGHLSYGLSSAGYDVRINPKFKVFTSCKEKIVDPLNFDKSCCIEFNGDEYIMPPHSFMMTFTLESFNIPNDIMGLCIGKSTYARCGIVLNVTPIEPGQKGPVVLELSNTSPLPVKVYAGPDHGICKFIFFKITECDGAYNGHYQNQQGIVLPHAGAASEGGGTV